MSSRSTLTRKVATMVTDKEIAARILRAFHSNDKMRTHLLNTVKVVRRDRTVYLVTQDSEHLALLSTHPFNTVNAARRFVRTKATKPYEAANLNTVKAHGILVKGI